jgi:hypothetical protein
MGTKSAGQGFSDLATAVEKSIEQMIIKITIVEPLMRALQSSISGSGILGLLGLGGAPGVASNGSILGVLGPTSVGCAPLVGSALGNVFSAGQVVPFAAGGVVDDPTIAPMALFGEADRKRSCRCAAARTVASALLRQAPAARRRRS